MGDSISSSRIAIWLVELVWEEVLGCLEFDSFLPYVDYLEREEQANF